MGNRLHRGMGGEASKGREIDAAQEKEPKCGGDSDAPERPHHGAGDKKDSAGQEKHFDRRAWTGNPPDGDPIGGHSLGHAVKHLKSEHPIEHDDHGPHHGHKHHIRHEPLHGLHPKAHHGRRK